MNNVVDNNIYSVLDICNIYSLSKKKLLNYLKQEKFLYDNKYIIINGIRKINKNYNMPKEEYNHLFKKIKQKGKNGYLNYKLGFTEKGKDFVGRALSMIEVIE